MAVPALLILAASAALKYQNDRAALKRQKRFQSAMESFQRKRSGESMAATEEFLKKQTPEARGSELADLTATREQSLRDTVGAAQAFDQPGVAGKKSADYRAAGEAEASRRSETLRRAIEQISTMGAPGEQQQAHGLRFGRAAGVVDASNAANEAVGNRYLTDIRNVRPNPFIDMVSQIGMGYALGGAGGAAAGAASGVNNGQGFEDSSGNLYDSNVTTEQQAAQDARIRRQMQQQRAFSLWGAQQ